MMVAAIDQRDPHLFTGESTRGGQTAEAAADDHHMRKTARHAHQCRVAAHRWLAMRQAKFRRRLTTR